MVGYFTFAAIHSTASKYPAAPLPAMTCLAAVAVINTRRNSSRLAGSDKCTSTTGSFVSSSASRKETLVCESPPGLMMIACAAAKFACSQSMSAPS